MSTLLFELDPIIRAGELDRGIQIATERLAALPTTPFHSILDLSITNDPMAVAAYFDDFLERDSKRFSIKAVYTETNGFDINPDRWFFDPFAYDQYGGHDDYDWLSDWQSADGYPSMTITGLEQLQGVYAGDSFGKKEYQPAESVAALLVVLKFQDLIRRSAPYVRALSFPLLATAHDYDLIYEVTPNR